MIPVFKYNKDKKALVEQIDWSKIEQPKVSYDHPDHNRLWKEYEETMYSRVQSLRQIDTSYEDWPGGDLIEGNDFRINYRCPACGGDGKETCSNPDHGFIEEMPGEIGRLGCPGCGHDPNHKVNRGKNVCPECGGYGEVIPEVFEEYGRENGYDEEPIEIAVPVAIPISTPEGELMTIGNGLNKGIDISYNKGVADAMQVVSKSLIPGHNVVTPIIESILLELSNLTPPAAAPSTAKEAKQQEGSIKDKILAVIKDCEDVGNRSVGTGCNYESYLLPPYKLLIRKLSLLFLPSSPAAKEDAVAFAEWVASFKCNGTEDYSTDHFILVDGEWYWSNDKDGDQPLTEDQLYKMFKQHSNG